MSPAREEPDELSAETLAIIRRAAFELRVTDPQEAVKTLRRVVAKGGPAAALARGALAEIYFEELADLDGAEGEFRALLREAPGLPAAELGLSRVLRASGRLAEAEAGLGRALAGLSASLSRVRTLHAAQAAAQASAQASEDVPEGADQELLLLLEVTLELSGLRAERKGGEAPAPVVDEALLAFAEEARLFDQPEDGEDHEGPEAPGQAGDEGAAALSLEDPEWSDWTRFYELVARLGAVSGAEAALARLRAAEQKRLLHPSVAARLSSLLLEELGRLSEARDEALRHLRLEQEAERLPGEDELLHAAGLWQALGDEPSARAVLQAGLGHYEQALARPLEALAREHLADTAKVLRELLGTERLVGLGRRR